MIPITQSDRDAVWLSLTAPESAIAEPVKTEIDWHQRLLILTLVFQFGLLPVLWNEATFVPSIVWTSIGAAMMLGAVLTDPRRLDNDSALTGTTMVFLVLYPAMCVLSYLLSDNADPDRAGLLSYNAIVMGLGALYFFIGASIARTSISTTGIIGALLVAGLYGFLERDSFSTNEIYDRFQLDGVRVDYQYLGDVFVYCALLLMPRLRVPALRIGLLIVSITVMFMIPSRSAAFFGAVALVVATLLGTRGWTRGALIGVLVIGFLGYHTLPLEQIFDGTRFESIFSGGVDTSIDLRNEVFTQGKRIIAEHPLTGYWAFQVDVFGTTGLYVHNAMDAWAQAGIIPFGIFVLAWLIAAYRCWELGQDDPQAAYASLPLLIFALLSWALARQTAYTLPMLALGHLAGQLGSARRADDDSADEIDRSDD